MIKRLFLLALFFFNSNNVSTINAGCHFVYNDFTICESVHNASLEASDLPVIKNEYRNVCWRCHSNINSNYNRRCNKCGWYICNNCGACESGCPRCPSWNGGKNNSSSSKTDNSWVWILIVAGVAVGGIIWYKKRK